MIVQEKATGQQKERQLNDRQYKNKATGKQRERQLNDSTREGNWPAKRKTVE